MPTSPEGVLIAKDREIALRDRLPRFSPFSPANSIFFKFPTTTQRAKRLTRAPFSATGKPGEVGGEGLCWGG